VEGPGRSFNERENLEKRLWAARKKGVGPERDRNANHRGPFGRMRRRTFRARGITRGRGDMWEGGLPLRGKRKFRLKREKAGDSLSKEKGRQGGGGKGGSGLKTFSGKGRMKDDSKGGPDTAEGFWIGT